MVRSVKGLIMLSKIFYRAANHLREPLSKHFKNVANIIEQHEKQHVLFAQLMREVKDGTFDELDGCIRISNSVHEKMRRRDGRKYVDSHIKSVVDAPNRYVDVEYSEDQTKLAWVHDTPEDAKGAWKVKHFRKLKYSEAFCDGLDGHSIRPGELYFDYIERLSKTIALEVKIGDNRHNWADNPKPIREKLYRIASHYLLAIRFGKIEAGSSIAEWAAKEGLYDEGLFKTYSSRPVIERYIPPSNKAHMSSIRPPLPV